MFKDMFTLSGRWGRLNRLRYFGFSLLANLTFLIVVGGLFFGAYAGLMDSGSALGPSLLGTGLILVIPMYLALCWIGICLMTKRLHDLNQSGWWVLGLFGYSVMSEFISGLNEVDGLIGLLLSLPTLVFVLWLLFWPGTDGDNQYGPDPRQQS